MPASPPAALIPPPPRLLDLLRGGMREGAFEAGRALSSEGRVTLVRCDAVSAEGTVIDRDDAAFSVTLDWSGDRVISRCGCPAWGEWDDHCPHAAALATSLSTSSDARETALVPAQVAGTYEQRGDDALERWLGLPTRRPSDTPKVGFDLVRVGEELRLGLFPLDRRRPARFLAAEPALLESCAEGERPLLAALRSLPTDADGRYRIYPLATGATLRQLAGRTALLDGEPREVSTSPALLRARWEPGPRAFTVTLRVAGREVALGDAVLVGQFPVHALVEGNLHPLDTTAAPETLARFSRRPTLTLPPEGASFEEVAARLVELGALLDDTAAPLHAPPRFVVTLSGGIESVTAILAARYGAVTVPVTADPGSPYAAVAGQLVRRDVDLERDAVTRLVASGLVPEGDAFRAREDRAIVFWLEGVKTLPSGWEYFGPSRHRAPKVRTLVPNVRVNRSTDWFKLDLDFAADDLSVDLATLRPLLASGRRFVKLGDGSVAELSDALAEPLKSLLDEPAKGDDALTFSLGAVSALERLAALAPTPQLDATVERLFAVWREPTDIPPATLPAALNAELRPYQKQGFDWLVFLRRHGLSGVLADEMGLGKTLQTLALLAHLKETEGDAPSLIVAPTSLLTNWERERLRFTPSLRSMIYDGSTRASKRRRLAQVDLAITSYAILRRDIDTLSQIPFRCVVLDEAQHVKNPSSLGAHAARALKSEMRLALTGTPIENRLFDLWSLFSFLMPGHLGSEDSFRRQFVTPVEVHNDLEARDRLKRRVRPLLMRRLKGEVAQDLPPRTETVLTVDLTPGQQALYREMLETARERVHAIIRGHGFERSRVAIASELLRLRQLCNDPRLLKLPPGTRLPPSAKLEAFVELLRDLVDEGHRALVFSQFTEMLGHLCAVAETEGIAYEYLDGSTTDRQTRIDRFSAEGGAPLFFISLKAGGFGLNLTAADYVIHFDPWWNPAAEAQATDRAHRIGQTKPVFSYKIVTRGTVEEKILALQARKKALASGVLGDEEGFSGKLTEADVATLFA